MRHLIVLAATLAASGCAGNYKTTFQHTPESEPLQVHVAPVLNQEELEVQIVTQDSSATTAQYGLLGALVGSVIDAAINNSRAKKAERRAEVIREMTADYDFMATTYRAAVDVGNHERWQIVTVDRPIATTKAGAIAAELFDTSDANVIALLETSYMLTPTLDQVRANVMQRIYFREDYRPGKSARQASAREINYVSPRHAVEFRPFHEGEKDAMRAALIAEYDALIEARPGDAEALIADRDAELEDLEKSDTIPEYVAIRETWNAGLLRQYLDQSSDHLSHMLQLDWAATTVPEAEQRTKDRFTVVSAMGMSVLEKGELLEQRDENVIYRCQWGALHSVPATDAVES